MKFRADRKQGAILLCRTFCKEAIRQQGTVLRYIIHAQFHVVISESPLQLHRYHVIQKYG